MQRTAAILAILLTVSATAHAQAPALATALERATAAATRAKAAGAIAIGDLDGTIADTAFGLANRALGTPHQPNARWLWASVTKQVTALLVMQEVDAGRLTLDHTLAQALPTFRGPTPATITIRQLLQHQSGLPNPDDTPADATGTPAFYAERGPGITNSARATGFCSGPATTPAPDRFSYNNCDYLVLGAILERSTGLSFAALVQARFAELTSLRVAPDAAPFGGADAIGYGANGTTRPEINVATFGAAGALTGTPRDLLALDRAMLQGRLLSDSARAILWQGNPELGYQALGAWSYAVPLKGCSEPVALIERRGDVANIQVRNVIAPALGRALVVFLNDGTINFGEVWQGQGLGYELLSAAFCGG